MYNIEYGITNMYDILNDKLEKPNFFKDFMTPGGIYDYCKENNCKDKTLDLKKRILQLYGYKTPSKFDDIYECMLNDLEFLYRKIYGDEDDMFQGYHYGSVKLPDYTRDPKDLQNLYNYVRDYPQGYSCLKKYFGITGKSRLLADSPKKEAESPATMNLRRVSSKSTVQYGRGKRRKTTKKINKKKITKRPKKYKKTTRFYRSRKK